MNGTPGTNETAAAGTNETAAAGANHTAAAGNGGDFGPREAAALLEQTGRQARRKLEPNPPLLSVARAVVVLVAYGAIWLSVRGQPPGPLMIVGLVAVGITAARANWPVFGAALAVAIIGAGALAPGRIRGTRRRVAGHGHRPVRGVPRPGCPHGLAAACMIVRP